MSLWIMFILFFLLTVLFGVGTLVWVPAFQIPFVICLLITLFFTYRLWDVSTD